MTDSPSKLQNNLSIRQIARLLKKFHIENGCIIALKHQSENANRIAIDNITKGLSSLGVNALVIVVDDFNDLSVLNETEMNKHGWFKMDSIAKLMKIPRNK